MSFTQDYNLFILTGMEKGNKDIERRRGGIVQETFQKFYNPHKFVFDC